MMNKNPSNGKTFRLSTSRLSLLFQASQDRLQLNADQGTWLNVQTASSLFAVFINGRRYDAFNLAFQGFRIDTDTSDTTHAIASFSGGGFEIDHHVQIYEHTTLVEMWQVIRSTSSEVLKISRLDSVSINIPVAEYELLYFTSDWGQEFEPVKAALTENIILETRKGRSSKGQHPWFALFSGTNSVLSGSIAWSGNWIMRFEALQDGGFCFSSGIHDWEFAKDLLPGGWLESAHAVLVQGRDLNDTSQQFAQVGRQFWYPKNHLSETLPVEWNHWWSYEDVDINEVVFRENMAEAASLGVEICTLDAGWFGGLEWYQYRGDWDHITTERFPNGIRPLADDAHNKNMKFGLWCEVEGLGQKALLSSTHPDFSAQRDGVSLGYVCMGNPNVQEWAYQTLSRLIHEYDCNWIKLDFNLDPEAGCNRTEHGHGAGDGLYEHYQGYYRLLQRIRTNFPEVILENCSSGGLRIDLGILRQTHMTFLSDPDYPVHDLQIFWGATLMLAANACLHWSYSDWRGDNPNQNFNPHDPNLKLYQFDYYTRIAMLGAFGFSQKLPQFPEWITKRLIHHIDVYKHHVRKFVHESDLYRLTDQPRRNGQGDRWCGFQYANDSENLLFVFRLPGAEIERCFKLLNLEADRTYQIEGFDGEKFAPMLGRDLMQVGLAFTTLLEEESALLRVW